MGVVSYLGLFRTVGLHAPGLHAARAYGIEPDVFALQVVFAAVVKSAGVGKAGFVAAPGRNGVDVVFAVSFGAIGQGLAVGGNTVEVAGSQGRH